MRFILQLWSFERRLLGSRLVIEPLPALVFMAPDVPGPVWCLEPIGSNVR